MYKPVCSVLSLHLVKIFFELLYALTKCIVAHLGEIIYCSKKSCTVARTTLQKQAVVVYARECMAATFKVCSVACHVN